MPADGSIIIDTRVNNKGAEADLKALQAKAKSTAQQIAAVDVTAHDHEGVLA